jgi:hypothetical protein
MRLMPIQKITAMWLNDELGGVRSGQLSGFSSQWVVSSCFKHYLNRGLSQINKFHGMDNTNTATAKLPHS